MGLIEVPSPAPPARSVSRRGGGYASGSWSSSSPLATPVVSGPSRSMFSNTIGSGSSPGGPSPSMDRGCGAKKKRGATTAATIKKQKKKRTKGKAKSAASKGNARSRKRAAASNSDAAGFDSPVRSVVAVARAGAAAAHEGVQSPTLFSLAGLAGTTTGAPAEVDDEVPDFGYCPSQRTLFGEGGDAGGEHGIGGVVRSPSQTNDDPPPSMAFSSLDLASLDLPSGGAVFASGPAASARPAVAEAAVAEAAEGNEFDDLFLDDFSSSITNTPAEALSQGSVASAVDWIALAAGRADGGPAGGADDAVGGARGSVESKAPGVTARIQFGKAPPPPSLPPPLPPAVEPVPPPVRRRPAPLAMAAIALDPPQLPFEHEEAVTEAANDHPFGHDEVGDASPPRGTPTPPSRSPLASPRTSPAPVPAPDPVAATVTTAVAETAFATPTGPVPRTSPRSLHARFSEPTGADPAAPVLSSASVPAPPPVPRSRRRLGARRLPRRILRGGGGGAKRGADKAAGGGSENGDEASGSGAQRPAAIVAVSDDGSDSSLSIMVARRGKKANKISPLFSPPSALPSAPRSAPPSAPRSAPHPGSSPQPSDTGGRVRSPVPALAAVVGFLEIEASGDSSDDDDEYGHGISATPTLGGFVVGDDDEIERETPASSTTTTSPSAPTSPSHDENTRVCGAAMPNSQASDESSVVGIRRRRKSHGKANDQGRQAKASAAKKKEKKKKRKKKRKDRIDEHAIYLDSLRFTPANHRWR